MSSGPGTAARNLIARGAPHQGAVVLGYHDVVADAGEAEGLTVGVDALRAHVKLLRRMKFRIVSLAELSRTHRDGGDVDGLAAIVFDDALAGVSHFALEALVELDVPACLAVVTTGMGEKPEWWPGAGPTMTEAQVHAAVDLGFDVIAHTRSHRSLPTLDNRDLRRELIDARSELEDLTGREVDLVAYPFGHHDARVRAVVAEAGYRAGYTFLNGRIIGGEDIYKLPRLTMGAHHSRSRLAYHLLRSHDSWPDASLEDVRGNDA